MPLAYLGTTKAAAQKAHAEGIETPAPVFTEDRKRACRGAEALIVIDPVEAGMERAPGYAIPRWFTWEAIPPEAILRIELLTT